MFVLWRGRGKLHLWQVRHWRRRSFEAYRPIRTLAEYLRAWRMLSRQLNITRAPHVARQLVSGKNSVFRRNLHSKGTSYTVLREKHVIQECRAVHKGDWVHFFILSFSFSSLAAAFAAAFASDLAEKDDRLEKLENTVMNIRSLVCLCVIQRCICDVIFTFFHCCWVVPLSRECSVAWQRGGQNWTIRFASLAYKMMKSNPQGFLEAPSVFIYSLCI